MSLSLMALMAVMASHSIQVQHKGTPLDAVYSAKTDVRTRTVGAVTPNKFDSQRCRWTVTVQVERKLANHPALTRTLPSERRYSGSLPGACTPGSKRVQQEVAMRDADIRSHVQAVAERDRAPLLAELEAIRNLAAS